MLIYINNIILYIRYAQSGVAGPLLCNTKKDAETLEALEALEAKIINPC